jgi:hypothetical protein
MVRLGVDVDDASMRTWDSSIGKLNKSFNKFSGNVEKSDKTLQSSLKNTLSVLAKSSLKIAGIFSTAGIGLGKFMQRVAESDMDMQKFARRLYISTDQAKALNNTLEAMDLDMSDLQDVAFNPELYNRYKELLNLSKSFKAPEGMKQSFKEIRTIFAEFQKFNITFNYFRERVAHFIYSTVRTPAQKFREFLQNFNTKFASNINKWAEKLGRILGMFLRMGIRLGDIFRDVGSVIYRLWDRLSGFSKGLIASFVVMNRLLKLSPIWRLMALISGVTLLYDDYKTFSEGGVSSERLKPIWKFVNEQREDPNSIFNKMVEGIYKLIDLINNLTELIKSAWEDLKNSKLGDWLNLRNGEPPKTPQGGKTRSWFLQKMEDFGLIKFMDSSDNRLLNLDQNTMMIPQSTPDMMTPQTTTNNMAPINQTFYFNVDGSSLENPQTFVRDVSVLLRNNQCKIVGAQ